MLAWVYRSGRQGIGMREGFDGDSFIGVVRGDVLENMLWFQRGTALCSLVSTAVAIQTN